MPGKDGGKAKPLKTPKKQGKDLDESDIEFRNKQKADAAAIKAYQQANSKGGGKKK
uniref:Translation machinery associated TMA7 n=1 Tax=Tetraselmis sp. GSL018 TaxID=582737 RepID=A0A061RYA9_9CHLO